LIGLDLNGLSSNFHTSFETSSDIVKPPVARAALGPDIVAATGPASCTPPSPPASVIGGKESATARVRSVASHASHASQYSDTNARRFGFRLPPGYPEPYSARAPCTRAEKRGRGVGEGVDSRQHKPYTLCLPPERRTFNPQLHLPSFMRRVAKNERSYGSEPTAASKLHGCVYFH
jgi:hypothetical protein